MGFVAPCDVHHNIAICVRLPGFNRNNVDELVGSANFYAIARIPGNLHFDGVPIQSGKYIISVGPNHQSEGERCIGLDDLFRFQFERAK
ncbi:hypothetical protein SDC9_187786 [bioreactor metagenome]|uniref:Uncharacterized protein n=1 Tax=bioreactor metagenome TaxID=1076179 RepID=A0A645HN44_9ZZZZ